MNDQVKANDTGVTVNHFHAYNASAVPAVPEGRRIVKCLYQKPSDGSEQKHANSYMLVPDHITADSIQEHWDELQDYLVAYLQGIEDSWVKSDHKAGVTGIADVGFTMDKVIAALETSGAGSRLNKETIEGWFDKQVSERLSGLLSAAWNYPEDVAELTEDQLVKLATGLDTYKAKFAGLSNPKAQYLPQEAEKLVKALEKLELAESGLGKRFAVKLDKMSQATADDLLLDL